MQRKEKEKLVKELEYELADIKIERANEEESKYLVDYLYGVSDVKEEIEVLLYKIRDNEWILLYQVLLNKNIIDSKEYYRCRLDSDLYFIMKNKEDLEKFREMRTQEIEKQTLESKKKIEDIYSRYSEKFKEIHDKEEFKSLLENYYLNVDLSKEDLDYLKATCELGEFLKTHKRKGTIDFKQADFFKEELGFKNTNEYPAISKKYKELIKNAK